MNKTALLLLGLLYGAALFADFLSPYPPGEEFRDHFFHPPSTVHFKDSSRWTAPYVCASYLVDQGKHVFLEGTPVYVIFPYPEYNKNPYIAELLEENPAATIQSENGSELGRISSLKETGENTGMFEGMTAIDIQGVSNLFVEAHGKRSEIPIPKAEGRKYRLHFLVRGAKYKLFGLFPCDRHLFGVDEPGHLFLFGSDQSGRDIFSRILYGARTSLTAGLIAVVLTTILGWWIGGLAGYLGGRTDAILMRIAEVLMAVPAIYLILAVRNIFPLHLASEVSYLLMIVVLSLTGWAAMSRVIRGMVLALREEQFVLAAKAEGASISRILIRHILPNTAGYVLVRATLLVPAYILAEVTLSFLGVGIQEPAPSWGNMLSAAQDLRTLSQFPWTLIPGLFLFVTVLAFNFFGEGIRKQFLVRQPQ